MFKTEQQKQPSTTNNNEASPGENTGTSLEDRPKQFSAADIIKRIGSVAPSIADIQREQGCISELESPKSFCRREMRASLPLYGPKEREPMGESVKEEKSMRRRFNRRMNRLLARAQKGAISSTNFMKSINRELSSGKTFEDIGITRNDALDIIRDLRTSEATRSVQSLLNGTTRDLEDDINTVRLALSIGISLEQMGTTQEEVFKEILLPLSEIDAEYSKEAALSGSTEQLEKLPRRIERALELGSSYEEMGFSEKELETLKKLYNSHMSRKMSGRS